MQQKIDIHGSEQFCIGRNAELCRHTFSESVISNRHLRIHCVLYEQDRIYETPPFVYATDMSRNGTYLRKSNIGCTSSQGRGVLMGQKSGAFLLDNGDELRMSDSLTLIYRSHIPPTASGLTALQKREARLFSSRFLLTDRILGIGGYGKVVIALHQKTQRQVACKIIKLSLNASKPTTLSLRHSTNGTRPKALPSRSAKCFREFDILKDLSHPNIITLEKVFWSSNSIYILEELVTGGDLFSYVEYKGGRLGDVQAAVIVRQILKGVEYLHDRDIVHRDLKPDNILMTSLDDGARIVITDFGNARALPEWTSVSLDKLLHKQRMFSYAGTLEFAAPEIHKKNPLISEDGGYSKSVDMWSVGCLTALLLSGDVIFTDRADPRYEKNPAAVILGLAATCNLSVLDDETHTTWSQVGSRPRNFIKKLLQLDESKRMTATESLHHPWFSDKKYAQEFDDLYQRSIRTWRPRPKIAQLVEPI
ncbi:Pkinase-domain-containing protein, partial [Aaosphaeria arxii CBS 175.79]